MHFPRKAAAKIALAVSAVGALASSGCSSPADVGSSDPPGRVKQALEVPPPSSTGVCFIDMGNGPVSYSCPGVLRETTEEELAHIHQELERLDDGTSYEAGPPPPPDDRDELLAELSARPGTSVKLLVRLPDPGFNWEWFRQQSPDTDARSQAIDVRRSQVDALFVDVMGDLKKLGIDDVRHFWIVPVIGFDIDSLEVAEVLASWPEDRLVWLDRELSLVPTEAYTGIESRTGAQVNDYHSNDYWGQTGSRLGGPIRIGIVEPPPPEGGTLAEFNHGHPGLGAQWTGAQSFSNSRFANRMYECNDARCLSYSPTPVASHGTKVASVALGTIENGQDGNISNQTLRVERSGIAPKASPYFFSLWPLASATYRLQQTAVHEGIDILNHSYEEVPYGNPPAYNPCAPVGALAWKDALAAGQAAGILNVFAAGNQGEKPGCTIRRPAAFRQGLVVGGLDSSNRLYNHHSLLMDSQSSKGGMDIIVNGVVHPGKESVVDMVAPGCHSRMYGDSTHLSAVYGPTPTDDLVCATSFAAPVAAGTAGLIQQIWMPWYPPLWNPGLLLPMTILMTDGWSGTKFNIMEKGFDNASGAGRLHAVYGLVAPAGWGCHTALLTSRQPTLSFPVGDSGPESPLVTMWKGVMVATETDRTNAALITMMVQDTCPRVGVQPMEIAWDYSYGTRKRIRLTSGMIAKKCLEVVITAIILPPGQTRRVQVCDYFHSGPPENH